MLQIVFLVIITVFIKAASFTVVDNIWQKISVPDNHPLFIHDKISNSSQIKCALKCQRDQLCVGFNHELDTDICFLYVSLHTNNAISYGGTNRNIYISLIGRSCVESNYVVFRHLNTCIKKKKIMMNWESGRSTCIAEGADLMILSTLEKLNLFYQPYLFNDWQHVYVGAKNESTWKWVDGTSAIFRIEAPSHPGTANCMELRKRTNEIIDNDTGCSNLKYFMCEKKIQY